MTDLYTLPAENWLLGSSFMVQPLSQLVCWEGSRAYEGKAIAPVSVKDTIYIYCNDQRSQEPVCCFVRAIHSHALGGLGLTCQCTNQTYNI